MSEVISTAPVDLSRLPQEAEFVCRGKETGSCHHYDHPRNPGLHILRLFSFGTPPRAPDLSLQGLIDFDRAPHHSYVADGHGALNVVAHPSYDLLELIDSLRKLTGLEITHCGDCGFADRLWDALQRRRLARGEGLLWGMGGDDTHKTGVNDCGLSWTGVKITHRHTTALKHAMRTGAVYASNGVEISDFHVEGSTITVTTATPCEVRWLRDGQFFDAHGLEVRHRYPIPLPLPEPDEAHRLVEPLVDDQPGANHVLQVDRAVTRSSFCVEAIRSQREDAPLFVRCVVIDAGDMALLRELVAGGLAPEAIREKQLTLRKACSMPFLLLPEGGIANPYPAKGHWVKAMTHNHADLYADRLDRIDSYHAAYRAKGIEASFETGYSYAFFPYFRYPALATMEIDTVRPGRVAAGEPVTLTISGRCMPTNPQVALNGTLVCQVTAHDENTVTATAPGNLAPGVYDVSVRDGDGAYQDTAFDALTVQAAQAVNDGWSNYGLAEGLPDEHVYFVRWLEGELWAGTRRGLAVLRGDRFVRVEGGPVNAEVLELGSDGRLWCSGWDGVYSRERDGRWRCWTREDGLAGWKGRLAFFMASFHAVFCAADGQVLLTHYRPGRVSVLENDCWLEEKVLTGQVHNGVTFLAQAPDGKLYAGSQGRGILERTAEGWQVATSIVQPPSGFARRLYFDPQGRLVVACAGDDPHAPGGVQRLENGKWRVFGAADGLPDHKVWAVAFTTFNQEPAILAATTRGLAVLHDHRPGELWTMLNSGLPHDMINDICVTPDGAIWTATVRGVGCRR